MANTPKNKIPVAGVKRVKIKHIVPPDLPVLYSDNMLVQNRDGLFTLLFMQNQYPIILTPEDAKNVSSADSVCVARVMTHPFQFAKDIRAMEENFTRFLQAAGHPAKNWREFLEMADQAEKDLEGKLEEDDTNGDSSSNGSA